MATPFATGGFRRREAQVLHQFAWGIKADEIAELCDQGDGDGELDAAQHLSVVDDRIQAPQAHLLFEFLLQALETFGDRVDRANVLLKDKLLRRGGADPLGEPSERGGSPVGTAAIAAIVSQQKGFESEFGGFEVLGGILTSSGEIANGFLFELGDVDGCEVAGSPQAREWDGVAAVSFDAITHLVRDQRRRDDPTGMAFFTQVSVELIAVGAGFVDEDQMLGLGLGLARELIDVGLAGADSAEVSDFGTVIVSDIGDRDGVFVNDPAVFLFYRSEQPGRWLCAVAST